MDYCGPRGIPHSVFLSWDPDDQAKALMWSAESAKVCGSCGTREDEFDFDRDTYGAEVYRCRGCELLEQEQENVRAEAEDGASMKGIHVRLVRKR